MFKKFFLVLLTLIIAVVVALLAARYPTGPNTISYDEPVILWITIGMLVVLFLPPLILSLYHNRIVNIISAVYQSFVVIVFLAMIPIGFLFPEHVWVSILALLGAVVSIASVIVILKANSNIEIKL